MNSQTAENYLKALFNLEHADGEVSVNKLSLQLGIKMPTVNSMMKKLLEKGLIHYEAYKPIRLTETGKKEAALIIRKHRLTEMYLVEKMGFGWDEVHEIAEQIEHIQSPAFFEKMDVLLGFPTIDPHGAPIPDAEGHMDIENYIPLSSCQVGQQVIFSAVRHSSDEFLKFLTQKQMQLGVHIHILSIDAQGEFMHIAYADTNDEKWLMEDCEKLLVHSQA